MNHINNDIKPIRVAIIQPIISPTRVPWFRELASCTDIKLSVFSLRHTMSHRPGWESKNDESYHVELVPSLFIKHKKSFIGAEDTALAGRIIPIGLTTKLIKYNPHVIILSNATEIITTLPARWITDAKIILAAEDTQHSFSNISRRNQILKTFFYKRVDAICAHSSQSKELLKTMGIEEKEIYLTPWAVDNDYFYKKSLSTPREITRKKLGLKGTTIITIGALVSRKGIQNLLKAWASIASEIRDDSTLLIVGSGPEYQKYLDFTKNNFLPEVKFTGHLHPDDVAASLGASDIFILPTLEDVWGLVVNEAMAIGLPILCSCYAGCSDDLVHAGCNGYVFDPLNPINFQEILNTALSNPDKFKKMGDESKKIINNFTVKKSVSTLVQAIRKNAKSNEQLVK